ncbi:MAG: DUF1573 domain-containing protein [Bacteroidia bacterium]|nr:DUF1573 domain-containing protein [Bacteroidia bacterium]MDW8089415.1 DUF1573 domain-containing protein [Bacteroidia bacterium]
MRVSLMISLLLLFWLGCSPVQKEGSESAFTAAQDTGALVGAAETTSAKAATSPSALAKIRFDKMEHDFGTIREGEMVRYRFRVTNPGPVPLVITDVKPSCGCTVPAWTKEPIPPNGEGFVEVVFDSRGRSGMQFKTVTVYANTDPPTHLLRFRGEVLSSTGR